jgi:hypothetical protein
VTFIVVEQVPDFNVLTDEPLTLQIFEEDGKTVIDILDVDAKTICAFFARHVLEIILPFFTVQFAAGRVGAVVGVVAVGGVTVGGATTGAAHGVNPSVEVRPALHSSRNAMFPTDAVPTVAALTFW